MELTNLFNEIIEADNFNVWFEDTENDTAIGFRHYPKGGISVCIESFSADVYQWKKWEIDSAKSLMADCIAKGWEQKILY